MRNIKVLFLTMLIVALLLSGANVYAYSVQPPGMTVLTPASGGFYLPGESVSFCVFVPGSGVYGNQIPVLTIYYPFRVSYSQSRVAIASLNTAITSPLGGYECSGSSEMPSTIWVPGSYNSGTHTWDMPEIQIEPSGVTSLSSEYLPGYIAMSDLSFYTSGTTTFFYTNPTSNSFLGVGTLSPSLSSLTYNCLSYAVGVNDCWLWPWAQNPTQTELDLFMARTAMYGSRPGNAYEVSAIFGADVIYYSDCDRGTGGDGHFARVMAWDSIGIPTVIQSKWGQCELIQSTGYSPFSSGTFYGNPKRYYKQK